MQPGPGAAATFTLVEGQGPPLVMIHGVGLDHTMWDKVMPQLTATRQVVRYDLLGHGNSSDPPGPRSIDDFVSQLLGVMDAHGVVKPDVAGLSLGGQIALAAAARHPDRVGRLALLNTVFNRSGEEQAAVRRRLDAAEKGGMTRVASLAINRWFSHHWQAANPNDVSAVRTRLESNRLGAYSKAYRVFIEGDPLLPGAAANVQSPTLAMTGALDPGSTPAMSRALAKAVPTGQALVLDKLRHLPPIESPAVFARALLGFLDGEEEV